MKRQDTENIFQYYTPENLTENVLEEIDANIKEYFDILLEWNNNNTNVA